MGALSLVNGTQCGLLGMGDMCSIQVGKFGGLDVVSELNPCLSPPEISMSLRMDRFGKWKRNFLAGNRAESRQIGPDYWPLWLQVDFEEQDHTNDFHFKACLEAAKTGDRLCFLDQNISIPFCDTSTKNQQSTIAISFMTLIFSVLLFTLLGSFLIWYRRLYLWKRYIRHVNHSTTPSDSSPDQSISTPPLLPGAKKFESEDNHPKKGFHEKLANENQPDSSGPTDSLLHCPNSTAGHSIYSCSFRESKLTQTSLTVPEGSASGHVTQGSQLETTYQTQRRNSLIVDVKNIEDPQSSTIESPV